MPPYDTDGFVLCSHGRPIRCIECGDEYARALAKHDSDALKAQLEAAAKAERDGLLSALNQVLTILRDLDCPLDVRVNMAHDVAHETVGAVVRADITTGLHRWVQDNNTGGNNQPCKAEGK
jgi:hypothetical protein